MQNRISEAAVASERALAAALQDHAETLGLPEWAGQVITNAAGEQWFGGVELKPSNIEGMLELSDSEEIEPGLHRIQV